MSDELVDWYYVSLDSQQGGPVKKADLKPLFAQQQINDTTQVWCDGMAGWAAVSEVPGLLVYLKPAPTPAPGPSPGGPFGGGMKLNLGSVQLKPAQKSEPSTPTSAQPEQQGGLFAAIAQRKAKMENAGTSVDADRNIGNQDHLNTQEDFAPKVTKSIPKAPEKKAATEGTNWKELKSPDGVPYYFNQATGETTWSKPKELLSGDELERMGGEWLWVPDPHAGFVPGRVLDGYNDQFYHVQTEDGTQHHNLKKTTPLDRCLWHVFRSVKHISDLVLLDEMSLPLILHALKSRFQNNDIYTNVGTILISINPYKRLPLYTPDIIDSYHKRGNKYVPPHVYLVASEAFNQLLDTKFPQSICISGESGAGKTECTKQALQFLAEVAGSSTSNVEQKILASNPILEAFGNAKTVRNNNSSRFGKYVEINFDHNLQISGSTNTNYLLEKVRVIKPNKGDVT